METPLKIRFIAHYLLMLTVILLPKISIANSYENEVKNSTLIQVFVNSTTGQGLADMVVYLEPIEGQILEKSTKTLVVSQNNKSFAPYLNVSQVNAPVKFVNKDDITHHIYSAESKNKFAFKIRAGETNSSTAFSTTAEIAMGCNIHDWMSGYLLVVNTPYFDKTDKLGKVSFNIAKHGKYKVVVWHPQMKTDDNRMSIEKNISEHDTLTFTLKDEMESIPMQKNDDDFDFLSDY